MTDSYQTAANHPLNIQFTWGVRTSAPHFSYAGSGEIDHITGDTGTYIIYNNVRFNLASVQLTSPTHNSWIIPSTIEVTKIDNKEDFIFTYELDTFSSNGVTAPKYIILVNPILRSRSVTGNPTYLTNIVNGNTSPITLEELFPYDSNKKYIYYTTCIPGNTLTEHYKNILVILNTQGTLVSTDLMTQIKTLYNKTSQGEYPIYIPLANLSLASFVVSKVSGMEGFTTASATSPAPPPGNPPGTYDQLKCVPFDPETNLTKDGKIVINTSTGVPFSQLDTARTEAKSLFTNTHTGIIPFTKIELIFASLCGMACLVILVLCFINAFSYSQGPVVSTGNMVDSKWWKWVEFFIFNIGLFIGGFVTGYFTIPASC